MSRSSLLYGLTIDGVWQDEVDPYKKPAELLELSPKGLVPALRLDNFSPPRALNESTVIMDFLEEYVLRGLQRAIGSFADTSYIAYHPTDWPRATPGAPRTPRRASFPRYRTLVRRSVDLAPRPVHSGWLILTLTPVCAFPSPYMPFSSIGDPL